MYWNSSTGRPIRLATKFGGRPMSPAYFTSFAAPPRASAKPCRRLSTGSAEVASRRPLRLRKKLWNATLAADLDVAVVRIDRGSRWTLPPRNASAQDERQRSPLRTTAITRISAAASPMLKPSIRLPPMLLSSIVVERPVRVARCRRREPDQHGLELPASPVSIMPVMPDPRDRRRRQRLGLDERDRRQRLGHRDLLEVDVHGVDGGRAHAASDQQAIRPASSAGGATRVARHIFQRA